MFVWGDGELTRVIGRGRRLRALCHPARANRLCRTEHSPATCLFVLRAMYVHVQVLCPQ
jgi:hypothetical protein